jgi:transcriptional regulator with XRE-family HTH domain
MRPIVAVAVYNHVDGRWTHGKVLGTAHHFGGQPWGFEKYLLTCGNAECRVSFTPVSARQPGHRARARSERNASPARRERRRRARRPRGGSGVGEREVHLLVEPNRATGAGEASSRPNRRTGQPGGGAGKRNRPPELTLRRAMSLIGTKGNSGRSIGGGSSSTSHPEWCAGSLAAPLGVLHFSATARSPLVSDQIPRWYAAIVDAAVIVRRARRAAGLSLRELAGIAGTSHSTLAAYETGTKTPSVTTLDRIVRAAGFSLEATLAPRAEISRGEELEAVLQLAEQFPARHHATIEYPPFPHPPSGTVELR